MKDEFLKNIADVLENARRNAKAAVNFTMVYAYFEIGRMIVEEEQNGASRAAYGKQILQELSQYLTAQFGKGFSVANLKNIRQFTAFTHTIKLAKQCLANLRIYPSQKQAGVFASVGPIT